jgi:hypothetical protein
VQRRPKGGQDDQRCLGPSKGLELTIGIQKTKAQEVEVDDMNQALNSRTGSSEIVALRSSSSSGASNSEDTGLTVSLSEAIQPRAASA